MNKEWAQLGLSIPDPEISSPPRQPRIEKSSDRLDLVSLLRQPLNLHTRGLLAIWLNQTTSDENFTLEEILPYRPDLNMTARDESDAYLPMVHEFLSPPWPDQEYMKAQYPYVFSKYSLTRALVRVYYRWQFGPQSITTLFPSRSLFTLLSKRAYHTIDQVKRLQRPMFPGSESLYGKLNQVHNRLAQHESPHVRSLASFLLQPHNQDRLIQAAFFQTHKNVQELTKLMQSRNYQFYLDPLFPNQIHPLIAAEVRQIDFIFPTITTHYIRQVK